MRKFLCVILAALMLVLSLSFLSGCAMDKNNHDNGDAYGKTKPDSTGRLEDDSTAIPADSTAIPNENLNEQPVGEVYSKYSNLCRIDEFHNGLAAFAIHIEDGTIWGAYYVGYMDIYGKVVIDPVYPVHRGQDIPVTVALPQFESNCVYIRTVDKKEYLIDREGTVLFQSNKNGVTGIGDVSAGYFWVETVKEELSGNSYSVEYYRAKDLKSIVKFDNVRAFNATLTEAGNAILTKGNSGYDRMTINIKDYDADFVPQEAWTVSLSSIADFKGAISIYSCVSEKDNTKGRLAAVILRSPNNVEFYAVVDSAGNVLMAPQKNIAFPMIGSYGYGDEKFANYSYCLDLCPAKDVTTQKWGYVNPNGIWVIQPQYDSAASFSKDGYATVNGTTVIDTTGKVVLSKSTEN